MDIKSTPSFFGNTKKTHLTLNNKKKKIESVSNMGWIKLSENSWDLQQSIHLQCSNINLRNSNVFPVYCNGYKRQTAQKAIPCPIFLFRWYLHAWRILLQQRIIKQLRINISEIKNELNWIISITCLTPTSASYCLARCFVQHGIACIIERVLRRYANSFPFWAHIRRNPYPLNKPFLCEDLA